MHRRDFHYELPPSAIAQRPVEPRSSARMLCLEADGLRDAVVRDWPDMLDPRDLVVFNDTRVIPARLYAVKDTGGRVEVLLERIVSDDTVLAQVRASKTPRPGGRLRVERDGAALIVEGRDDEGFFVLRAEGGGALELFERAGHMPLPPYIGRADDAGDRSRYQTVFAQEPGAVAAPTASLHFDAPLLDAIRARGVATETLTLHVGAGTFTPLRVDDPRQHRMHAERYTVSAVLAQAVQAARARGGRVVAVGTTVVRALESAAQPDGSLRAGGGETRLLILPGFRFRAVDALLTNFHLPESTLLMLVCAFAGRERVLHAYREAVARGYRFFSYGDAMYLPVRDPDAGV